MAVETPTHVRIINSWKFAKVADSNIRGLMGRVVPVLGIIEEPVKKDGVEEMVTFFRVPGALGGEVRIRSCLCVPLR